MRMRALPRWSASSLSTTVPRPCQGEPSRCIAQLLLLGTLEEARVDGVEARVGDGKPRQRAVGSDHGAGRIRPDIVIRGHAVVDIAGALDGLDAGDGREPRHEVLPGRS